jgi:hypothetical protein
MSIEKLDIAINQINNIHPDKIVEIKKYIIDNNYNYNSIKKYKNIINDFLSIKAVGSATEYYWISRGWPGIPAPVKNKNKNKGRLSPFNYLHWIEKGYSEEEAKYKANSLRPIKKEYWIEKGYSEEESVNLAIETKQNNNLKGNKNSTNRDKEKIKLTSVRCLDYWINYHLGDIDKAKESLKLQQTTFSKEICTRKYGEENGNILWNERQDKWRKTFEENNNLDDIKELQRNTLKSFILKYDNNINIAKEKYTEYLKSKNIPIINTYEDFVKFCEYYNYTLLFKKYNIIKNLLPNYATDLLIDEELTQIINSFPLLTDELNLKYSICKYTENGKLLKSSFEIQFYNKLLEEGFKEDIDFSIERKYKEDFDNEKSNMKSDFYFYKTKDHIEICGMMKDEKYKTKMLQKKEKFNCTLVQPNDIIEFIRRYKQNHYNLIGEIDT